MGLCILKEWMRKVKNPLSSHFWDNRDCFFGSSSGKVVVSAKRRLGSFTLFSLDLHSSVFCGGTFWSYRGGAGLVALVAGRELSLLVSEEEPHSPVRLEIMLLGFSHSLIHILNFSALFSFFFPPGKMWLWISLFVHLLCIFTMAAECWWKQSQICTDEDNHLGPQNFPRGLFLSFSSFSYKVAILDLHEISSCHFSSQFQ